MVEHLANVKEDNPHSTDPCFSPVGMLLPELPHEPSPRLDAATRAWLAGLAQAQWRRVEQGRPAPPRPSSWSLLPCEREGRLLSAGV